MTAIRGWLAEHVHAHGRRLDTEPLVEAATGRGMDAEPFLRHARAPAARRPALELSSSSYLNEIASRTR